MTYPSYSYLTPATLEMALRLARELRRASGEIGRLANGGAAIAYNYLGTGGRTGDKATAVKDWIGPHHDTFELLFDNEMSSAGTTEDRLAEEADAWAAFWATAINARNARLHDEAVGRYSSAMSAYQTQAQSYSDAVAEDPELANVMYMPSPPMAPTRPPLVTTPTAAGDYQPTG